MRLKKGGRFLEHVSSDDFRSKTNPETTCGGGSGVEENSSPHLVSTVGTEEQEEEPADIKPMGLNMDLVKKIVGYNNNISLAGLNEILVDHNQRAAQVHLDTARDELGITIEEKELEAEDDGVCKGTKANGEPCTAKAKENGYCGRHQKESA